MKFLLLLFLLQSTMALGKYATGLVIPKDWKGPPAKQTVQFHNFVGTPVAFDWRDVGLTPVENQGSCGSCWAFASTSVFEDHVKITTGKVVDYSEQYMVDCNTEGWGCNGGWVPHDYLYKKGHNGTHSGTSYRYTGREGQCRNMAVVDKIVSWKYVTNNVEQLKQAIYLHGPIFTTIYVDDALSSYRGGVFSQCSKGQNNHAVTIVGWGSGYWIMKNSWGASWGEKGYMRIKWGCNNIGDNSSFINYRINPRPEPEPPKPEPEPPKPPKPEPEPPKPPKPDPEPNSSFCDFFPSICNLICK